MSNLTNGLNRFGFAWGWPVGWLRLVKIFQKGKNRPRLVKPWSYLGTAWVQTRATWYDAGVWGMDMRISLRKKHWNWRWEKIDVGAAAIGSWWDGLDLLCAVWRKQHEWAAGKDERMSWNQQHETRENTHSTHILINAKYKSFNLQYKTTQNTQNIYISCLPTDRFVSSRIKK